MQSENRQGSLDLVPRLAPISEIRAESITWLLPDSDGSGQEARETLPGQDGPPELFGTGLVGAQHERRFTLKWLQRVLESRFQSQADSPNGVRAPEFPVEGEEQTELDLADLCGANFPHAHGLWLAAKGSHTPGKARRRGRANPGWRNDPRPRAVIRQ